jgi:hypothetical protein
VRRLRSYAVASVIGYGVTVSLYVFITATTLSEPWVSVVGRLRGEFCSRGTYLGITLLLAGSPAIAIAVVIVEGLEAVRGRKGRSAAKAGVPYLGALLVATTFWLDSLVALWSGGSGASTGPVALLFFPVWGFVLIGIGYTAGWVVVRLALRRRPGEDAGD